MIHFSCPECGKKFQLKDEFAGRNAACPGCKAKLTVPQATDNKPPASSDTLVRAPTGPQQAGVNPTMSLPAAVETKQPGTRSVEELLSGQNGDGSRYVLEGEIARGGMGAILRGVDRDLRREVAVKVMLDGDNTRQRAHFVEEAQITGQLEHPNIVPVHELGVDGQKRPYFAMKMVRGRSLAQIIDTLRDQPKEATDYTTGKLMNILVSVCHALAYAHSRGVIHRDLKPANIMVGDFGEVYVMDWGLAKVLTGVPDNGEDKMPVADSGSKVVTSREGSLDKTQDGAILGTPAYMAPEQALGQAVDRRSDIYALGAILYSVLTFKPPIDLQGDYMGVLMAVAEGNIVPPAKRTPKRAGQIPAELSAIAMKALAKEPERRYQGVEEFRRDLELFLEGRAVSAKADSTWEMAVKFVRRNKGFSAAALVGTVLLLLVLGASALINYQERVKADEARVKADEAREQADAARIESQTSHANYLRAQEDKRRQAKASAPAFVRAARLMTNEQNFDDALAQVTTALDADPDQTEAYLLRGQVLIALKRFAEGADPLQEYAKRKPEDALAQQLADLARRPDPKNGAYLTSLWEVFDKQKALPFAGRMAQLMEDIAGPKKELLAAYRKRIEAVPGWAGKSFALVHDQKTNTLRLSFFNFGDVTDVTPLKGMQLDYLNLRGTSIKDITPLQGMPLTWLNIDLRNDIKDLAPLRGMKLTSLSIIGLGRVPSLEPLKGMPLESLNIAGCLDIPDLEPLRGMPLTEFYCFSYGHMKLNSVEPLTGMKMKKLDLGSAKLIRDIRPLRDMPLEWLNLGFVPADDFEPLRGKQLTYLDLRATRIRDLDVLNKMPLKILILTGCSNVKVLTTLTGMPLTGLHLEGCPVVDLKPLEGLPLTALNLSKTEVRDLTPLAKMKNLTDLRLYGCKQIESFKTLKDLPLVFLGLDGCAQFRDLEMVRNMKDLQHLRLWGCNQIDDLTPLKGMQLRSISLTPGLIKKGWQVLWDMTSIDTVDVEGQGVFPLAKFRELHEKGSFK